MNEITERHRGVMEALAEEVEAWDREILAQRALFARMHHAPTQAGREDAARLAVWLFSDAALFTEQAAA